MKKPVLRGLTVLGLLAALGSLRSGSARGATTVEDFQITGIGIWQCQCPAYACPCQQNGLPKFGMCHASDFAHIKKGRYGKVMLDDLNVAIVGNLVDGNAERLYATLYIDNRATAEQNQALTRIVEYMNKEANQPPVPFRKIKVVPIAFHESPDQTDYSVDIPDILQEKALLQRDHSGKPQFGMAAMDLWSNTVHNADNVQFKYHDPDAGGEWDYSGHYSNLKYFNVGRTNYAERRMLGQHGDNSGKWTPKQLEIIRREKLGEK
jgi:hypothetical protein